MTSGERKNCQQLIFTDGNEIRVLNAETEEEASEILEYIHANGYDLIAIEGRTCSSSHGSMEKG